MQYTRRFALGALASAVLAGCGGGGGGDASPAAGGAGGGAASGTGTAGTGGAGSGTGGQTPVGQGFSAFGPTVVASGADPSLAPAVARLGDGGNVVLWVSGGELRGRRTDAAGAPLGDVFVVATGATRPVGNVDVAPADDGGFVVAWILETTLPFSPDQPVRAVQARRYDASGSLAWDARATGTLQDMEDVRIEPLGDGFVLGWTGSFSAGRREAWIGRIAADGSQVGDQYPVGVPGPDVADETIGIAPLEDGTVVTVWRRRTLSTNSFTMFMRHFAADLNPLAPPVALPGFASTTAFPIDAEGLAGGNVAIAWGNTGENSRPFVSTAVFTPSGTPASAVRTEVTELPATDLQVLAFGDAGHGVAWQVVRGAPRQVSATPFLWRFSPAGEAVGAPESLGTRLTFWVSPTSGETVNAGSGIDFAAGADGHHVAAYHQADTQADTYLVGR